MGQRNSERTDFAALERRCQRTRAGGGLKALLEQRVHALAELRQLRRRPLAPEQIAAEFRLELLDGPRQRWLRHVALVGRAREVENPRDCEKIAHLMHFHDRAPRQDRAVNLPITPP